MTAAFEVRRAPVAWRRVWGTALTSSIAYLLGVVTGHPHWGAWAFFGGFTSLYVADQPYRPRAQVLCAVILGLAAAMFLGGISKAWWVMAPVLGAVSASAAYLTGRFRIPLPSSLMFILVACVRAAMPDHSPLASQVLLVLIGGIVAWLVGMSGWPLRPHDPEARRVRDAYHALAAYLAHWSDERALTFEHRASEAVAEALAATGAGARRDAVRAHRLSTLAERAEEIFLAAVALATETADPLPVEIRREVARLGDLADPVPGRATQVGSGGGCGGTLDRRQGAGLSAHFRAVVERTRELGMGRPAAARARPLANVLRPSPVVPYGALRIGLAVAASVLLAHLLGVSHPYWVPLTCAAVLQGETALMFTRRAIQRVVGTVGGLLLAGGLIVGLHIGPMASLAVVVVLQALMLVVIAKNYAFAVAFVTAFALLILNMASPAAPLPLLLARLRDTVLGTAVAVASTQLLWPRVSSKRLPVTASRLIAGAEGLFTRMTHRGRPTHGRGESSGVDARREAPAVLRAALQAEILRADGLARDAEAELPRAKGVDRLLPVVHAAERLGYLLLAAEAAGVDMQVDGGVGVAEQVGALLRTARRKLEGGAGFGDKLPVPHIWPPVERELRNLTRL